MEYKHSSESDQSITYLQGELQIAFKDKPAFENIISLKTS